MKYRLFLAILASLMCGICCAAAPGQFATAAVSAATDIPINGWNKVLMLRNGNTVVLHLAQKEKVLVKVFDSLHKEIASEQQYFKILAENDLRVSCFNGFYDIGGFPTLFISQEIDDHYSLLRVRFDPANGKLVDERIVFESRFTAEKGYVFFVSKSPETDDYAIFCWSTGEGRDLPTLFYNKDHQLVRKAYIHLPTDHSGLRMGDFRYSKEQGAIASFFTRVRAHNTTQETVQLCRANEGDTLYMMHELEFSGGESPTYQFLQFNPHDNTVNFVVNTSTLALLSDITSNSLKYVHASYFTVLNADMSVRTMKGIKMVNVNKSLTDGHRYQGFPLRVFTNRYGITTVLFEDDVIVQNGSQTASTVLADIGMTKFNEEGDETAGLLIGKLQAVPLAFSHYDLMTRMHHRLLFRDKSKSREDLPYTSVECLSSKTLNYLFFNDYTSNEKKKGEEQRDIVVNFPMAEAMCYKINGDDVPEKCYLFGYPELDEAHSLLIESMDLHPAERKVAGLVSITKGKERHLHVAWCTLN